MHTPVRIYWQRFQCRAAALYHRRVTVPVKFWLACGRPPQFRPHLPWWHPFLHSYLCFTGWRTYSRSRR